MKCDLIGQIFVSSSACTEADVERALSVQESYGGKIGSILLNMGVITEEQLLMALAQQLDIAYYASLDGIELCAADLDSGLLQQHNLYPCKKDQDRFLLLTNNPLNLSAISLFETMLGKRTEVALTKEENLKQLALQLSADEMVAGRVADVDIDDEIDKLKELASEAPVIKLVNSLLAKAVEQNATDIHFEALRNLMKVRFRVDGLLTLIDTVPQHLKSAIIARLKLISSMNIAENRLPQDGRIALRIAGREVDVRSSSVPTQFGESFVLRLLGKEGMDYSLESLGLYPDQIELIRQISKHPNGIFLTTGPTGSGKTTTLYSMLSELNSDQIKVITIEDPVEYEFKGVSQINVRADIGFSFATALRSILRQDPDTIMVGEIRDLETLEIAIQSALTGHLVLSTLHTNSALASIPRLIDMGLDFFLLRAALVGVMAQRLVRRLCPHCSEPSEIDPVFSELHDLEQLQRRFPFVTSSPRRAVGCDQCNQTGFKGRLLIAEVIALDDDNFAHLSPDGSMPAIETIAGRSMFQDGLLKVIEGQTSLDEILRASR